MIMTENKTIVLEKSAVKFIRKQPPEQQKRILSAIDGLPDFGDRLKMQGYKSLYRLRVGSYRVLYSVDNDGKCTVVTVSDVDNRGQVYK